MCNKDDDNIESVLKEACQVITAGLHVLYPQPQDKYNLLRQLLINGECVILSVSFSS